MKEYQNYEEFLNEITEELYPLLKDSFNLGEDFYLQIGASVDENNEKTSHVFILTDNRSKECVVSTDLEALYKNYLNDGHCRGCITDLLEEFYNSEVGYHWFEAGNFEKWKSHVITSVINYDRNEELLRTVPHFRFLDLAVVFRVVVKIKEGCLMSFVLTNEYFPKWKISMAKLFELAKENTKKILPVHVSHIKDVMADAVRRNLLKEGMSLYAANLEAALYRESLKNEQMCLMSNAYTTFGASAILDGELFNRSFETDVLIAPSSIHELIIFPNDERSIEILPTIVQSINRSSVVKSHEFLSDHIYLFDKKEKKIKIIR